MFKSIPLAAAVPLAFVSWPLAGLAQSAAQTQPPAQAAPPAIPDDQNAAPLYLKVAAQIEPHQPKGAGYPEGRIGQGGWKPGQPMLYGVADWWNPDAMKALSDLVRSDEKSLQLLYQAAARPGCRFDLKWSDGFAMTLPHLAKMRAEGLVATRRDAQTIYYRLASDEVRRLIAVLYDIYCR